MNRELINKMYSPTAYFLGRFTSNMIFQIAYPMTMILCLFWALDIDESPANFWWMTGFGLISNTVFCAQGYFLGICFPDDESAVKLVNLILIMLWVMTNGVFANLKTANWFIVGMSKVSPSRYNCEGFFRRMIGKIPKIDLPPPYNLHISQQAVLD